MSENIDTSVIGESPTAHLDHQVRRLEADLRASKAALAATAERLGEVGRLLDSELISTRNATERIIQLETQRDTATERERAALAERDAARTELAHVTEQRDRARTYAAWLLLESGPHSLATVKLKADLAAAQVEATEWRAKANAPFVLKDTPIEAGAAVAVYPGMTFKLKTTLGPEAVVAGGAFQVWPPPTPEVSGGNFDVLPVGSAVELERLRAAIRTHRAQKADDRCIEDDDRLYEALGDGVKCDRRVGDKAAMLANCARFIERRCEAGGWRTYAALEAEVEKQTAYSIELQRCCEAAARALRGLQFELPESTWSGAKHHADLLAKAFAENADERRAHHAEVKKLADFKRYVHSRFDRARVPADPEPAENAKHGCRVEGRFNWLLARLAALEDAEHQAGVLERAQAAVCEGIDEIREAASMHAPTVTQRAIINAAVDELEQSRRYHHAIDDLLREFIAGIDPNGRQLALIREKLIELAALHQTFEGLVEKYEQKCGEREQALKALEAEEAARVPSHAPHTDAARHECPGCIESDGRRAMADDLRAAALKLRHFTPTIGGGS